jgi:hypothetical protein
MIGTRIANGLLSTAVAAAIVGCGAPASKPQTDTPSAHPSETLAPLFHQVLPNVRCKTFTSAIVTFPPAARAVPHRHGDAFVYAYVLEGTVSSQLEGQPAHIPPRRELVRAARRPPPGHREHQPDRAGETAGRLRRHHRRTAQDR